MHSVLENQIPQELKTSKSNGKVKYTIVSANWMHSSLTIHSWGRWVLSIIIRIMFCFPFYSFSPQFPLSHIPGLITKFAQIAKYYFLGNGLEKNANHTRDKTHVVETNAYLTAQRGIQLLSVVCKFAGVRELEKQFLYSLLTPEQFPHVYW